MSTRLARTMLASRLLARKILEQPLQYDWSIQGLGMLRCYLSPQVRLHVWNPVAPYKRPNVSEPHNHPWDFVSEIVAGSITNHIYGRCEAPYGERWMAGTIECGPNPKKAGACEPHEVRLMRTALTYSRGDFYAMEAETIHRSDPIPGTVTICHRVPRPDPDHATVCWPVGEEWVSAEPRVAHTHEIEAFALVALALMRKEDEGL